MSANDRDFRDLVAQYYAQELVDSQGIVETDTGRRRLFGQGGILQQRRAGRQAGRQVGKAARLDYRGEAALERAIALDPTLADAYEGRESLPMGSDMARSDNRAMAAIPDGYTDPTWLTVIPDQALNAATALSVTTPPPSTFYAAYLLISVSAGANALVSVSAITIGGVPMLQGAGAFGADALSPASFNVAPVRRIIATSQPITISITNNDAAARRVSAYFFGYLMRSQLQNY